MKKNRNKKMLAMGFLSLIVLLPATYAVAIEDQSAAGIQKPGPKKLSPEEVQKVKTGIMLNLLKKVQQKTDEKYRVSIQIWNKKVLETLQKTEGVTVVQTFERRVIADVDGKVLEQILQDKLSGKYEGINLINLAIGDTDQGQTSLLSSSRYSRFSGGLSPPDDTEDWWAIYVHSYEDKIEIDSRLYDWIGCDVDLYLYDPNLVLKDEDTWDFNSLNVDSNTNIGGYWKWQYWGEYLDDDGTGYSGTVTIYDN